ncbi:MAG TPA: tetratricopeptide repeat protein [Candidatus Saccharimonadales bacterium]|nr:tetratricopeptide repeat protein [Candidatus Saccharimonadales bacterium]
MTDHAHAEADSGRPAALPGAHRLLFESLPVVLGFVLLTLCCTAHLAAQQASPSAAAQAALESHFAAATQAQRERDFSTAEREYRAVLALKPDFAEVHMNLGLLYQLQNRSAEAISEFESAVRIKPTLTGANFFLGVNYTQLGEGGKAIPFLQAAIHAEPQRPELWHWLATAQEISGQLQAEILTLHTALELQPRDIDLLYLLGNAYERLGKQEVAHLQKIAPGSSRSEQLLAESYASTNEWPSAAFHFQNALAASPNRPGLHAKLGEVFLHADKVSKAGREFEQELQRDPGNLRALVRHGEAKLILGDADGALLDWEKALAIDPGQTEKILGLRESGFGDSALEQLPETIRTRIQGLAGSLENRNSSAAHLALAFIAEQNGNTSQAAAELKQTDSSARLSRQPAKCTESEINLLLQHQQFSLLSQCAGNLAHSRMSTESRFRVTDALLEAGQSNAALKILGTLPPVDRQSAEAAYWRARCYEKLATASYLQLYQADPNSFRLHQLMGDLEEAKGNDGKAIEEYRAAVALKPSAPNLHYSLGHLLWKDLKIPEARAELEAELRLNPRHSGALNDLGDTYLLEHQPDKALPYLLKSLQADPANPNIHRDLGTAYSGLGDNRKAEENFKIAIATDQDGSVHYKLARVYQALGEKENAAKEFAISTALNQKSHEKLEKQTQQLEKATKFAEEE